VRNAYQKLPNVHAAPSPAGSPWQLVAGSSTIQRVAWSPDGKTLAFGSDRSGNPDIWTVSVDGGEPKQLTAWSGFDREATWSLDGSAIYLVSDEESRLEDLWSVPAGAGQSTRLTTEGTVNNRVAVSATGELFLSVLNGLTGKIDATKRTEQRARGRADRLCEWHLLDATAGGIGA